MAGASPAPAGARRTGIAIPGKGGPATGTVRRSCCQVRSPADVRGRQTGHSALSADGPRYSSLLGVIAGLSAILVIVGLAVAAFFNPLWIAFEQDRTGVAAITGFTPGQVQGVTGSILADLFFGPPAFAVSVNGRDVLDAAERSHMVDVRAVLLPALLVLAVATMAGAILVARYRRERWLWRAVGRAAGALTVIGVVVGIGVLFFFDAAFLLFHLVFFPQGNFSFDPRTERLTQLFPEQFWTETTIGVAAVGLALAAVVALLARRQLVTRRN